jgi:aldehyde:ferredoxin oxidoreductase
VYGTNVLTNIVNEAGAYRRSTFSMANFKGRLKSRRDLRRNWRHSARQSYEPLSPGCVIRCSGIYTTKTEIKSASSRNMKLSGRMGQLRHR